ncbi:MAG: outer membrane protein transport protein [bacterium]
MRRNGLLILVVAALTMTVLSSAAFATNGYFSHGVGQKAKGMAGAGVAYPQDALAAGINPAGMAFVGNRFDIGLEWFSPDRGSEIAGNDFPGVDAKYDANDKSNFFIPELGYNRMMNEAMALGIAVFGRGGMNTAYTTPVPLFAGQEGTKAGVDLNQLYFVPNLAYMINENHSIGVGIDIVYQWFKATGLQNFDNDMMTSAPGKVTDNDNSTSFGAGVTVGWMGRFSPMIAAGLAYQSRAYMSEFDDYAGLFAEKGDFDIPPMLTGGFTLTPSERMVLALDIAQIWYSEVKSINNPLLPNLGMYQLGTENGAGFGWQDMTVYKLGVAFDPNEAWTLRGGYNYGEQPIPTSETLFNILAPGVVESHLTLGATWRLKPGMELTASYMHAFEKEVKGENSIIPGQPDVGGMGGGEANLRMNQNSFGIALGLNL